MCDAIVIEGDAPGSPSITLLGALQDLDTFYNRYTRSNNAFNTFTRLGGRTRRIGGRVRTLNPDLEPYTLTSEQVDVCDAIMIDGDAPASPSIRYSQS